MNVRRGGGNGSTKPAGSHKTTNVRVLIGNRMGRQRIGCTGVRVCECRNAEDDLEAVYQMTGANSERGIEILNTV